jgi:hypothetical protein
MYCKKSGHWCRPSAGLQTRHGATMHDCASTIYDRDYRSCGKRTPADGRKNNNIMLPMPIVSRISDRVVEENKLLGCQYFIMYARLQMFHSYRKHSTIQPTAIAPPAHLILSFYNYHVSLQLQQRQCTLL